MNMYPNWLTVENAKTLLISLATKPMLAANSTVIPPVKATQFNAIPLASNNGKNRVTRKTPAATIVAAWIKEDTGVGPSIASGNQVCSGNCALFPTAPANSPNEIHVAAVAPMDEETNSMSGISNGFKPNS